ncbi:MAG TPA: AsmA-like C-terminal region-containing protein [Planctomycetota bacterium]|nr:AsmA-like C-terminal region-containing protein [Planctomycetota bacterium]
MSRRRRFLLAALPVVAVLVAVAPMLARTAAVRRFVAGRVSDALGRPVEIEGLDAGWLSGVEVLGLVVRNGTAEFRGEPLLEARSIRLPGALPSLVFSGADDIAIDGLVVRLEEQAGGRTNIDDLVKSLATPRPPAPGKEVKPIRFRLTDAKVQIRRLLRRPQPRPLDPFREDPVVLPADEGLFVVALDDLDLLLAAAPGETSLDLTAKVRVGDREGRAEIRARLGPRTPTGLVHLEGIDLALLRPLLEGLEGRVDLRIEGSAEGAELKLRAEGLKAGPVDEAWAEVDARVRKEGEGVLVEKLAVRTASDALSFDARGAWPAKDLEISARVPTALLGLRAKGPVTLDARGKGRDLAGTLAIPDAEARFDVTLRDDGVSVRKLDAKARGSTASLEGDVADTGTVRLSGSADVDLKDLAPLLPEGKTLEGRLQIERLALENLSLKADAIVTGLLARGFFAEDLDLGRGELHVDAALSGDRDVLTIARAQLDGLVAQGTVEGLKGDMPRADGTVKGTLALNPLHARLLGIEDVRGLRGQLAVDVLASTGAAGVSGEAAIEGLHVETARGSWELKRVDVRGSYKDGAAEVSATSDGLRLAGSLAGGKGHVELDVDAIERHPLLLGLLPADVALEGPLALRADLEGKPWDIRGTLSSERLTARLPGRGVEGAKLLVSFTARDEGRGWLVAAPGVALGDIRASLADGFLGRDGSRSGRLTLKAPLEALLPLAPEAKGVAPRGALALDVRATHAARWEVAGAADVADASFVLAGERTPGKSLRVEFDALPEETGVTLRRIHLTTRLTDIEGAGAIGKTITLRMDGKTRLEEIVPYAPALRGSGEVTLDGFAFDLAEDGALGVSTAVHAAAVRVEAGKLTELKLRTRLTGRLASGAIEGVKTEVDLTAAKAERGNVVVEDLVLRERGAGGTDAYALGTRVQARRLVVGATSWLQVGLDLRGRLDRLFGDKPPTGVTGDVTFGLWNLGPFRWKQAKGKIEILDGNVLVKNLVAGLEGGTVKAEGRLVPTGDRLAWEGKARAEGVVLSEEIGRPLSFVIPFLRVEKQAGTLSGRGDFEIELAAEDTTDAAILRTLAGKGNAHLYEIEAKNSILLPLLSLRLDKAILGEPYRFKDLKVAFDVANGRIRPQPFELKATPFGIDVKEIEVGLDGTVDALIIPGVIPLRVKGTLDDPKVRPAPLAPFR